MNEFTWQKSSTEPNLEQIGSADDNRKITSGSFAAKAVSEQVGFRKSRIPTVEVNSSKEFEKDHIATDVDEGKEYSLAAKKLFRALSSATVSTPDRVIQNLLYEVDQGHKFSQKHVLHTLGVHPEIIEEVLDEGFELDATQSSHESLDSTQDAEDNQLDTTFEEQQRHLQKQCSLLAPFDALSSNVPLRRMSLSQSKEVLKDSSKSRFSQSSLAKIAQFISTGADSSRAFEDIATVVETFGIKGYFDSAIEYLLVRLRETFDIFVKHVFPYQEISLYLFICLVQIISFKALLRFVPVVFCYLSFISMSYWTLMVFHNRRLLKQLKTWRRFLSIFVVANAHHDSAGGSQRDVPSLSISQDENLSALFDNSQCSVSSRVHQPLNSTLNKHDESLLVGAAPSDGTEARHDASAPPQLRERSLSNAVFFWQNIDIYGYFITSMIVFILAFSLAGKSLPNCFFLATVSLVMFTLCISNLNEIHNRFGFSIILLNVFPGLPSLLTKFQVPYVGFLFDDVATQSFGDAYFRVSLSSVTYLLLPFLYCAFLLRSYLGISQVQFFSAFRTVLTLIVICFWWNVTVTLLLSGKFHLETLGVLTTCAILSVLLFPSLVAFGLVASVAIYQLRESLNLSNVLKAAFTIFILFIPFLYKKLQEFWMRQTGHRFRFTSQKKFFILIGFYIFLVVMSVSLLYHGTFLSDDTQVSNFTWQQFDQHCGPLQDESGLTVNWKGAVQAVKVAKIDNSLENVIEFLPQQFAHWLRCFYGSKQESTLPAPCGVSGYNVYSLEVIVSGPWGQKMISSSKGSVLLTAGHAFLQLLADLTEGDVISFVAKFDQTLLRYPPRLKLLKVVCVSCKQLALEQVGVAVDITYSGVWSKLFRAFKFLFNFLFGPLVLIKT